MSKQTFGSALKQPWALARHGANQAPGRRPGTSIVYLTDDEGDSYLGGYVWFGRSSRVDVDGYHRDRYPCWHYRYKHQRRIAKAEVLHIFRSTDKSKFGGPTPGEIRTVKKALPVTPREQPVKIAIPITWGEEADDVS
jgi:hypothetical protein